MALHTLPSSNVENGISKLVKNADGVTQLSIMETLNKLAAKKFSESPFKNAREAAVFLVVSAMSSLTEEKLIQGVKEILQVVENLNVSNNN